MANFRVVVVVSVLVENATDKADAQIKALETVLAGHSWQTEDGTSLTIEETDIPIDSIEAI